MYNKEMMDISKEILIAMIEKNEITFNDNDIYNAMNIKVQTNVCNALEKIYNKVKELDKADAKN